MTLQFVVSLFIKKKFQILNFACWELGHNGSCFLRATSSISNVECPPIMFQTCQMAFTFLRNPPHAKAFASYHRPIFRATRPLPMWLEGNGGKLSEEEAEMRLREVWRCHQKTCPAHAATLRPPAPVVPIPDTLRVSALWDTTDVE